MEGKGGREERERKEMRERAKERRKEEWREEGRKKGERKEEKGGGKKEGKKEILKTRRVLWQGSKRGYRGLNLTCIESKKRKAAAWIWVSPGSL